MRKLSHRLKILILAGIVTVLVAVFLGPTIQNQLLASIILRQSAPNPEVAAEMLDQAPKPHEILLKMWNTEKIPFRTFVLDYLKTRVIGQPELFEKLESTIIQATQDPDMNARERSLGILGEQKHSRFPELAMAQFDDTDPLIRLMGLQFLRQNLNQKIFIPEVAQMLDDSDLQVAASAASMLRKWTGNDFGTRMRMTIRDPKTDSIPPEIKQPLLETLKKWKEWWKSEASKYPDSKPTPSHEPPSRPTYLAEDFTLENLSETPVTLSDFRGKVVLLNFWATWCTACLTEIPDLIALQKEFQNELVVLGVSLDGRPDGHGHDHSSTEANHAEAGEAEDHDEHGHENHDHGHDEELDTIRRKVARTVKSRRINYPVVLNPAGDIGTRFSGHELPTNVIIDTEGFVRRRFIGTRPKECLRAMVQEAQASSI